MSVVEIIAAVLGLIAVGLTIGRSVWCWPIGLIQVLLYQHVFYEAQLYSQTLLQIVFAILQIHGWLQWLRSLKQDNSDNADATQVRVEHLSPRSFALHVGVAVSISVLLGVLMLTLTQAQSAMADAFIAGLSLVAQWLLIHRKIENWYLWIVVNILTILVCWAQQMWPTVVLYMVFLVMAVQGMRTWQAEMDKLSMRSTI